MRRRSARAEVRHPCICGAHVPAGARCAAGMSRATLGTRHPSSGSPRQAKPRERAGSRSASAMETADMTSTASPVRVLIADDQTLFRIGLAGLLERDERIEIVGHAADGDEAVTLAESLRPHAVLMDLKMPNVDGIEATRRITTTHPETRVVLMTTFETDSQIVQALKAGASGYV